VTDGEIELAEWIRQGKRLGLIGRAAAWWIGDWVNYGNARFGEKYTRAARVTGYDVQSLMNMAYVASRFDISRRREELSWSHHSELAALDPSDQDKWLEYAAAEQLSVRGLREELRGRRHRRQAERERAAVTSSPHSMSDHEPGRAAGSDESDGSSDHVLCPNCGYQIGA
jgi:hypothetical protein